MSFLPGGNIQTALVSQFRGAVTSSDSYAVDPAHSIYARNCAFVRGNGGLSQVNTRLGHAQVVQFPNGDGTITSAYNWYFTSGGTLYSMFMYYAPSVGGKYYNLSGSFATIFTVTGAAGAVYVGAGNRIYAALYDSTGQIGSATAQVYGWGVGADNLFAQPLVSGTDATVSIPTIVAGGGTITPGVHNFAFITTTRNGFTGPIQPIQYVGYAPGYTNDYVGYSTATSDQITFRATIPSLPAYLSGGDSAIQVVMTTAANPNRWFAVPGLVATPVSGNNDFIVNISDSDLTATGVDVTDSLNLLVTLSGVVPFKPVSMFKYSARMGYCTIDSSGVPVVYISNKNAFQYVTADQHGIYLEGEAIPVAGVSLQSNLYIAATTGFYSTVDSGDVPSTWTSPTRVDGSVGVVSPTCLLENSTSGYVIVASPGSGLFLFGGAVFPELPLSYHQQSDWNRINWALPTKIQLCEDVLTKKFLCSVPVNCDVSTVSNTNPITVTTVQPHLMQVGLSVTISGVVGTTSANTTATIASTPTANTFTIAVSGNGAYVSGGTVSPNDANAVMSWDYTEGFDPDQVKYSLRSFTSFRIGAITRIFNTANAIQEVWYAAHESNPGNIIRQVLPTAVTPYRDVDMSGTAVAIDSWYQTSNLPGSQDESTTMHDYTGVHMRVKGSGSLVMQAANLDGTITVTPARSPLTLSLTPAQEVLVKWFLRSEQQTFAFGTNAVDNYFIMALIRAYYAESMPQR